MEVSVPSLRGAAESVWEAVVPVLPAFTVEVLAQIDSTNTELMRRARAGQTAPTLLVAERQTAGRGRLGRDWHSATAPQDGALASLTFSLGMALPAMDFSGLSLAAGLAVVQSLHPALRLKWPNDVWVHDRKLGGILIETAAAGDQRFLVVGVGLNILPVTQSGLRMPAAALVDVLPDADAASALLCVAPALVAALQTFAQPHRADLRCGRGGRGRCGPRCGFPGCIAGAYCAGSGDNQQFRGQRAPLGIPSPESLTLLHS